MIQSTKTTCLYTWTNPQGWQLTFRITGTVAPYQGAIINADPDDCREASGGVEEWTAKLVGVDDSNWYPNLAPLTLDLIDPDTQEHLARDFERWAHQSRPLMQDVNNELLKAADDQGGPDDGC